MNLNILLFVVFCLADGEIDFSFTT